MNMTSIHVYLITECIAKGNCKNLHSPQGVKFANQPFSLTHLPCCFSDVHVVVISFCLVVAMPAPLPSALDPSAHRHRRGVFTPPASSILNHFSTQYATTYQPTMKNTTKDGLPRTMKAVDSTSGKDNGRE